MKNHLRSIAGLARDFERRVRISTVNGEIFRDVEVVSLQGGYVLVRPYGKLHPDYLSRIRISAIVSIGGHEDTSGTTNWES